MDIEIITQNPFRILGVCSNATKKDIVAHEGRMKAFLKVGKAVTFPLDLLEILSPVTRTAELVAAANAKLTLPQEKLHYAQFWFIKDSQIDEIALNQLTTGNVDKALEIWQKKECLSSLQNQIVISLIRLNLYNALTLADRLYSKYSQAFVTTILGEGSVTTEDLGTTFIETLANEAGVETVLQNTSNTAWIAKLKSQSVQPLISEILSSINIANDSRGKGAAARYSAGVKLMNDTKETLKKLKGLLPTTDMQYQMVADKLGSAVLQCAIDYFNDANEPGAARKALKLQNYAQSVVVGQIAKDRCTENGKVLKEIISNLPPEEIFAEDKAIKDELRKYCQLPDKICHAITLLNQTKPHLQAIKARLGDTNAYYLKISTQVVGNALHNVIEEVNASQEDDTIELGGHRFPMAMLDPDAKIRQIKTALSAAWKAIVLIDSFDLESDFRTNRYNPNRRTLKSLCEQIGVSTYVPWAKTYPSSRSNNSRPSSRQPSSRPSTSTPSTPRYPTSSPSQHSSSSNSGPSDWHMPGWVAYGLGVLAIGLIGAMMNGGDGFAVGCSIGLFTGGPIAKAILCD